MSVKTSEKNISNFLDPFDYFLGPFLGQNAPKMTQIRKKLKICSKNQVDGLTGCLWVLIRQKNYFKFFGPLLLFLGPFLGQNAQIVYEHIYTLYIELSQFVSHILMANLTRCL